MRINLDSRTHWDLPDCCHIGMLTYVIESAGCIKIGSSARVHRRLAELSTYCPTPIRVLGITRGSSLEHLLHSRCAQHRIHHEWFRWDAWLDIYHLFADPSRELIVH